MYNIKDFVSRWWYNLVICIEDFRISLNDNCTCSIILGILALIPFVIYIIYGFCMILYIVVYNSKTKIVPIIKEHNIDYHIKVIPL